MAAALPTPAHSVSSSSSQLDIIMSDESPFKRKRSLDDMGDRDRDQKKMHLEGSAIGIEDLHLDVGEKYLLCQHLPVGQTRKAPLTGPFSPLSCRTGLPAIVPPSPIPFGSI